jgi:hypothetical protein
MSEVFSMVTALTIIVIILLSSGSRIYLRRRFQKQLRPHLEALERASQRNAQLKVTTK